jgi:hypothetical protein
MRDAGFFIAFDRKRAGAPFPAETDGSVDHGDIDRRARANPVQWQYARKSVARVAIERTFVFAGTKEFRQRQIVLSGIEPRSTRKAALIWNERGIWMP